ncbi:MAG: hypothetical protein A3J07_03755 [Candidatus Doudnabacteria bacterium RIFCSPLOWO2_02_FULL_49_13]|uniref:PEP-utilising enzyme mobile domain-containing protein n=1 Tax=Candidatus Doudnabacteria bacterium RIFCSPHIGHO2_12_FULL_48_16 TaxID=1817838 RepID=A0A1F5PJB4_9BACT|nr:MAG: hypothetical protein A3B77_02565 [Candidatus Doudnabacteria bacterium RIFCSPHIGHO2_02_FULL_49_24]OGE89590.1 MAG: hypothetical protein A2760_03770 [Candidatus Doudnabacteria bacterium RIFCSPHIGHO2_01_FULL_50_67]OGE90033.1 MAG: hypothetical protein A3E29_02900 [Candidatus Doudnabacteria bacterium RIFCSPHIGHO2_12_FULL_48_16]OGE96606.1 MAG: hypothetical protein A2990_00210 [Candidatus Doudnabacteria bacterium RIFCSPLOWO2_01_FULL_49_40]OGF03176.1 MAG: hypothetical protein A3J07_03755 [Candid
MTKKITYRIMRTRKYYYPIPSIWNTISESTPKTKQIHGINFSHVWLHWRDFDYNQIYRDQEWQKVCTFITDRIIKDKTYVSNVYQKQIKLGQRLVAFSHQIIKLDLSKYSIKRLLDLYQKIHQGWLGYDQVCTLPWFCGADNLRDYIFKLLEAKKVSAEKFIILSSAPVRSFSANEELDLLKLALSKKLDKKSLDVLVDKYFWIPFGYDGPATYDREHYRTTLKELSKQGRQKLLRRRTELESYEQKTQSQQQVLLKKYNIDGDTKRLLRDLQILSLMTDQRKEFHFQSHVAFAQILQAMGKKLGIDHILLKFLQFHEIKMNLNNPDKLVRLASLRKSGLLLFTGRNGKLTIMTGPKAEKLGNEMMPKLAGLNQVSGQVASIGRKNKLAARARVILVPSKIHMMKGREILIAPMTSPEYVPAMRKAAAIVTDEGGITSHAAIVSRELNKLCIIGTKFATKVFKDGDMVEVDADKGVVRLVSSEKLKNESRRVRKI